MKKGNTTTTTKGNPRVPGVGQYFEKYQRYTIPCNLLHSLEDFLSIDQ